MPSTKRSRSPSPPNRADSAEMKSAPSVLGSPEDPWSYHKETVPADVPVRLLPQLVQLANSEDPKGQLQGTLLIRKLLCVAEAAPIGPVVASQVVPRLISFMPRDDDADLQLEAMWAVAKVACGAWVHTGDVLVHGAVPHFIRLLSSPSAAVREKASWALATMVGDSAGRTAYRVFVLGQGALAPLLECIATPDQSVSVTRNGVRALSNLCGAKPCPELDVVRPALPVLASLLTHDDAALVSDACWGLAHIAAGPLANVKGVLDTGALPQIISLLTSRHAAQQTPAARVVGNIAAWDDEKVQLLVSSGALPPYRSLLKHPEWEIRKEACWTLSNIIARPPEQMQAVIDAELLPAIFQCIGDAERRVKVEAVWCVVNLAGHGTPEQVRYAAEELDVFKDLVPVLAVDDSRLLKLALDALTKLLERGDDEKQRRGLATNPFVQMVAVHGGVAHLEALGSHTDKNVHAATKHIIRTFLGDLVATPPPQLANVVTAAEAPAAPSELSSPARSSSSGSASEEEVSVADNFERTPSSDAALKHSVPHQVISQVIRPDVAAFMADDRVVARTHDDELCCVDKVEVFGSAYVTMSDADVEYLQQFPHLVSLEMPNCVVDAAVLGLVAKLTQLRHLDLSGCRGDVGAAGLAELRKFPQLQHLTLRIGSAAELAEVEKITNLQHLDINYCPPCTSHVLRLASVAQLSRLQHLDISGYKRVDAVGLASVGQLTQLRYLSMFECHGVDASGLGQLAQLRHLDLAWCRGVNAEWLVSIGQLTQLLHLSLSRCSVNASGFAEVGKLAQLQHLDLSECRGVTAEGLAEISKLTQLRHLDLRECAVNTSGLASVGKLLQLQHLNLERCRGVAAAGLAEVSKLTRLRYLNLDRCALRRLGLASVAQMSQLQHLDLTHCDVNAVGLASVGKLTRLRHLNISWSRGVDAAGLASVGNLSQLEHLDLKECSNVEATGLAWIEQLTKLRHLDLTECRRVDGAGFASVGKLTRLEHLGLSFCTVGAAGLTAIAKLPRIQLAALSQLTQLRYLDVTGCPLDEKYLAVLRRKCYVERDDEAYDGAWDSS